MTPATVRAGLLALLAAWACQSAPPPQAHEAPAPPPIQASGAAGSTQAPVNRDLHGPADVGAYIARLEAPERLRELAPELVVERLEIAPESVVADLGCGPGIFALPFARAASRGVVYAIDVEPAQLDRVREKVLAASIENVVPVLASFTTPHLPPGSCDLIFIGDTFHHIEDRVAYMRRLARALKPGGRLAVLEYKPGTLPVGPPADHKLEPGELHADLEGAGYELVSAFATHPYHDFEIWRPRAAAR